VVLRLKTFVIDTRAVPVSAVFWCYCECPCCELRWLRSWLPIKDMFKREHKTRNRGCTLLPAQDTNLWCCLGVFS